MKKRLFLSIFVLLIPGVLLSADLDFTTYAKQQEMAFRMPKDFFAVPVIKNRDVSYNYAIKHSKKKLEIRYAIFGLKKQIEAYKRSKKNPNLKLTDPNKRFVSFTYAVCLNISGGNPFKNIKPLKPADVRKEFNADGGVTVFIEPKSEFGREYKYVIVVALHRDSVADSYIFYLFDNIIDIQKEMSQAFHTLTYRK